jgi:hypothetical protein
MNEQRLAVVDLSLRARSTLLAEVIVIEGLEIFLSGPVVLFFDNLSPIVFRRDNGLVHVMMCSRSSVRK